MLRFRRNERSLGNSNMSERRVFLFDVPIDLLTLDQTVARAECAMATRQQVRHVALNVAKLMKMRSDIDLRTDVSESDLVGIDGMGIVYALRLFGCAHIERVSGVDLMLALLAHCAATGRKPYVLGARADVLERAVGIAIRENPGLSFAGLHDGYFGPDEEAEVVADIRASNADCLFVAMPTPRKERFLHRHAGTLDIPFMMGVGGSVDVLAGKVTRAPAWMQRNGMEWLHRLIQEPRKMAWRYLKTNTQFAAVIARALVTGDHPLRHDG